MRFGKQPFGTYNFVPGEVGRNSSRKEIKMTLKEIAKILANKAGCPYCWEDILERLKKGKELPFKYKE